MNKFKVGQKVVIDSGAMRDKTATVIEVLPHSLVQWYNLKIEGKFDSISYVMYQINQQPPEIIEIHRYYNEESQVECFYHQKAISCLWVMGENK